MNYTNLFMVRGDSFGFDLEIVGVNTDLDEAFFSCREDVETDEVEYIFQKSIGDGITKVRATEDSIIYHIELAPEDTDEVDIGNYYYDVQISKDGNVFTPLIGRLNISYDVTRPEDISV